MLRSGLSQWLMGHPSAGEEDGVSLPRAFFVEFTQPCPACGAANMAVSSGLTVNCISQGIKKLPHNDLVDLSTNLQSNDSKIRCVRESLEEFIKNLEFWSPTTEHKIHVSEDVTSRPCFRPAE